MKKVLIAVTGASGQIYAKNIIDRLRAMASASNEIEVDIIFSIPAKGVWKEELESSFAQLESSIGEEGGRVKLINNYDFNNRNASGSGCADVMIILPCSMGTIGRIAAGTSDTLILRAADVMLKERKRLVLVPRECPFSLIHLRNMTALTEAGAIIASAAPSFYLKPSGIEQMVSIFVSRILELAGIEPIDRAERWGE